MKTLDFKYFKCKSVNRTKNPQDFLWANPEDLSAQEHIMTLRMYSTNLC